MPIVEGAARKSSTVPYEGYTMQQRTILELNNISKSFPGVQALQDVSFELKQGEVHALLGENGSGKSTLVNIIGGVYKKDNGEIYIDNAQTEIENVRDATNKGISVVHQELSFVPDMTVADNIFLGKEFTGKFKNIDKKRSIAEAAKMIADFGSDIDPTAKMKDLSVPEQQVVEIVKALSVNAKIIAMDEPTASLSAKEVDSLYSTVEKLKSIGISVLYITHRMEEIFRLADRVTVFRDGKYIGTKNIDEVDIDQLITMMVGRELDKHNNQHIYTDEVVLECIDIADGNKVKGVNIKVRRGEVVGLSGIVGAGRSEFVEILAGVNPKYSGDVVLEGNVIKIRSVADSMKKGIVLVPEDRKKQGLVLNLPTGFNITIASLKEFMNALKYSKKTESDLINSSVDKLNIKVSDTSDMVRHLSGGNQQKVVLAKWLIKQPKILILDEPTKGIDVGAKAEIYDIIDGLAELGVCVLIASSDLAEIMRICDTVYIMRTGKTVMSLDRSELDQELIIRYATGVI